MPDFNNRPIFIGAGVTVMTPNFYDPLHAYDMAHGTVVALYPGTPNSWIEVRFDNRKLDNVLFEGFELLMDENPKRHKWD